jgi:autotransporter-associated beta strand protein
MKHTTEFATLTLCLAAASALAQGLQPSYGGGGTYTIPVTSDFEFTSTVADSARIVLERTDEDEILAGGAARTVLLAGPNDSSGGMELRGATDRPLVVAITNVTTMPASGGIDIHANAALKLAASSPNGNPFSNSSRKGSTITVHEGGTLLQPRECRFGVLPHNHQIVLDGGVIRLNDGATPTSISAKLATIVLNDLTFSNGGRIENGRPYVGLSAGGTWRAQGDTPVSCPDGVTVSGYSYLAAGDITLTLNAEDVTGDDGVDFSIGVIRRPGSNDNYVSTKPSTYAVQSNKVVVAKTGAGTLEFAGANTYVGPTSINAGTIRLGATKCLDYSNMVTLNGGSIHAALNTTNVIKKLKVSKSGSITLESGALLTVRAIDTWDTTKTLTVDVPDFARRLRFATANGTPVILTSAQLGALRNSSGKPLEQDADGWVLRKPRGTVFMAK